MKTKFDKFYQRVDQKSETFYDEVAQREEIMMYNFNETKRLSSMYQFLEGHCGLRADEKVNIDNVLGKVSA
jgi:hypothetical protein